MTELKIVEPIKPDVPVNTWLVGKLEWLLEQAKQGDVTSIAYVYIARNNNVRDCFDIQSIDSRFTMLGAIESLKIRFMTEEMELDFKAGEE